MITGVIDLRDIEYKEEITKKLVFDNEQSSLTLLSFRKGSERSQHCDKQDEVAQIIEGLAEVTVGKTVHRLIAGQMIVMPATIPHGLRAVEDTKMLLLRPKHTH